MKVCRLFRLFSHEHKDCLIISFVQAEKMKIFLLGVQFHPPKKLHNAPLKGCNVSVLGLKLASAASQWTESVIPPSKCKKTCRMDVKSFKKKFVKCTDFLLKVKETSLKFLELSSYLLALLNVL